MIWLKLIALLFITVTHAWIAAEKEWWVLCGVCVFLTVMLAGIPLTGFAKEDARYKTPITKKKA